MKIKAFLFGLLLMAAGAASAMDPMTIQGGPPNSDWTISHSTVSVSSITVTTISSVRGYRSLWVGNVSAGTTIYYRVDSSTINVPVVGFPIYPMTNHEIEANNDINLQLGAGADPVTYRQKTIRK